MYEQSKTPSFSIFSIKGYKVPSLKACFIERMNFVRSNLPAIICAKDGIVYQAVYESRIPEQEGFEGIVSFQQHTFGNFAVIRVVKNQERTQ